MRAPAVVFQGPRNITIAEDDIPTPADGQLLIKTEYTALSAGTELLFYRGAIPPGTPLDTVIPSLSARFTYPCRYGYALVGRVHDTGPGVPTSWQNQRVFLYHPHAGYALTTPDQAIPIPDSIASRHAAFYPAVETALTLALDSSPLIGEQILVLGQGVIGLLTVAILGQFPIGIITIDPSPRRRRLSRRYGADITYATAPEAAAFYEKLPITSPDLILELSGNTTALTDAIKLAGYHSRIIVGSWYGDPAPAITLGEPFHRKRLRLTSSQVSTLAPQHLGRWNRARRTAAAWQMLEHLSLDPLITHMTNVVNAQDMYEMLDTHPEQAVQVLFSYEG